MPHPPGSLSLYSVIMPARDEQDSLPGTLRGLYAAFSAAKIPHEIVVVDDGSKGTAHGRFCKHCRKTKSQRWPLMQNQEPHGFGRAIIQGLNHSQGDAVVIMMADASDSPREAIRYWRLLNDEGYECAFGSRFIKGGRVVDYPRIKLLINRLANFFIKTVFAIPLNDTTNAFKAYRRTVIDGCRPLLSPHFNLTVETLLKAIACGATRGR